MCVKERDGFVTSWGVSSASTLQNVSACLVPVVLRGGEKTHSPWWSTCCLLGTAAPGSGIGNYFMQSAPVVACSMVFSFMAGDLYLSM